LYLGKYQMNKIAIKILLFISIYFISNRILCNNHFLLIAKIKIQSNNKIKLSTNLKEQKLDEDLYFITGKVSVDSLKFDVKIIKVSSRNYEIKIGGLNPETLTGYSLYGYLNRFNGIVALSGGFRTSQDLPTGLVIENGKISNRMNKTSTLQTGILTIKGNVINIIKRDNFNYSESFDYALQSGPIIVEKGGINGIYKSEKTKRKPASRGFIGIDKDNNILLGISSSVYLYDLAEFLRNSDSGLNCDIALNLEGGIEALLINIEGFHRGFRYVHRRRPNAIILVR